MNVCSLLSAVQGRSIGITIGCFIGMFPLLFLKGKEDDVEE